MVTLHPDSLRNPKEAIKTEIERYRNKYKSSLANNIRWRDLYRGILVEVRYVELASPLGEIHDEYPFIHCEAQYGTRIFRPEKGTQLSIISI